MSEELKKLESWRKELAVIETFEELKLISDSAEAYQELQKKQGIAKHKQDEVGEFIIEVKEHLGKWLNENYPHGSPKGESGKLRVADFETRKMPVAPKESAMDRKLVTIKEKQPELYNQIKEKIKNSDDVLTPKNVYKEIKKVEKQDEIKRINEKITHGFSDNKPKIFMESAEYFLDRFENNSIDLLFTDPPYSTDIDNMPEFLDSWLYKSLSKLKNNGRAFICIGAYPVEIFTYLRYLLNTDWIIDNPLIWTYRNTLGQTPKMKYNLNYQIILHLYKKESSPLDNSITNEMFSVQDINAPDGRIGDRFHSWQKPMILAERIIKHSTSDEDIIIDPFACTGTFLIAAAKFNRIAYGCDIDEGAIKIAIERGCNYENN